jgi:hypothetical protein
MIRRFVQCKNTKERLNLMAASNEKEWAEGELDTIIEIFGLHVPEGVSKTEKWALIMLSLTNKEAADEAALGQKLFHDVEEVKLYTQEELKYMSDLVAYVKVCRETAR